MNLGPWELLIIALVIFLLFGATRLPNAARSLGRSMRIFKSEMDEMKNDKNQPEAQPQQDAAIQQAQPQAPVQGETPEQTRMRLEAQQQAQQPIQPQQPVQQQPQQPVQQQPQQPVQPQQPNPNVHGQNN